MGVALTIAYSIGILIHAVALPVFALMIFYSGPEKRKMTCLAALGSLAGIFTYLLALTDGPEVSYVGFGIMRGLFEVQRALFLRMFTGPYMAVFGLVFVANSLGTYTYDLDIAPVVVSFVATVFLYTLVVSMHAFFRHLMGTKGWASVAISGIYALIIVIIFALSPAIFDVTSVTVEFYFYAFSDLLLVIPALFFIFDYYNKDHDLHGWDFLSIHQGVEDEFKEIYFGTQEPDEMRREQYYGDEYPIDTLPPDQLAYAQDGSDWRLPGYLKNI